VIDWDGWRRAYRETSYQDQVAFYDQVWAAHPSQVHFDAAAVIRLFNHIARRDPAALDSVAEVGGWRGELAATVLGQQPGVGAWRNVEICRGAAEHPVCVDPRYSARVPDRWVWELPEDGGRVLILSHVIEHMLLAEASELLDRYPEARWLYIQSPLPEGTPDWSGYQGSHVIDAGWRELAAMLAKHRFFEVPRLRSGEARCFMWVERPAVSIIMPTYNRTELLTARAIPSVLAQTDPSWECLVIGDGTEQATTNAMAELTAQDPRFCYVNLPHYDYGASKLDEIWPIVGLASLNHGLDHARGEWIAVLADDDEYTPDHNEILLAAARPSTDFIYGVSITPWGQRYGAWPPGDGQLANGAYLYRGEARKYRYDFGCVERGRTGDADMWIRMVEGGVRFQRIDDVVHRYYPSASR
jgi:hypothetical protein